MVEINMGAFSGLSSTGALFNQIISLSAFPVNSFSSSGWSSLVSLIMSLLQNPIFYGFIGLLVVFAFLLPKQEDND